jgi:hypothetical protein
LSPGLVDVEALGDAVAGFLNALICVGGGASDIACAATGCAGWSGACKYQQLRCFARSVRKYQWLPAGAGEFGAIRQSSARAVFVGTPTPAHHQTRAISAIDPIGFGICTEMIPRNRTSREHLRSLDPVPIHPAGILR